jgi:hypothetical protein
VYSFENENFDTKSGNYSPETENIYFQKRQAEQEAREEAKQAAKKQHLQDVYKGEAEHS